MRGGARPTPPRFEKNPQRLVSEIEPEHELDHTTAWIIGRCSVLIG